MKHLNILKLVFGVILTSVPIIGVINFIYDQSSSRFAAIWHIRSSNALILLGLFAIAGAILLASIKSDSK